MLGLTDKTLIRAVLYLTLLVSRWLNTPLHYSSLISIFLEIWSVNYVRATYIFVAPSGPDTGVTSFTNQALYEYVFSVPASNQLPCSVQDGEA
jgi:hypothetical protein